MKVTPFAAPVRLLAAMPLILGLATIVAAPAAHAVTINQVDIIDGLIDVNEDGLITVGGVADDLANVMLSCNGGTLVRVDIIDGKVDVTESGVISVLDDANDVQLFVLP